VIAAAAQGHIETLELLIAAHANVNLCDTVNVWAHRNIVISFFQLFFCRAILQ